VSLLLLNGLNERLLGVVHVDDGDLDLEGAHGLPVIAVVVVTEQLADGETLEGTDHEPGVADKGSGCSSKKESFGPLGRMMGMLILEIL
jgi:hypothetical protein